jgi:hypothetical protein
VPSCKATIFAVFIMLFQVSLSTSTLAQSPPLDLWPTDVMLKSRNRTALNLQVISRGVISRCCSIPRLVMLRGPTAQRLMRFIARTESQFMAIWYPTVSPQLDLKLLISINRRTHNLDPRSSTNFSILGKISAKQEQS